MTPDFRSYRKGLDELIRRAPSPAAPTSSQPDPAFDALALDLFRLQWASVSPYRLLCESRALSPASVRHWTEIPPVPVAAFKDLELTSLPHGERTRVFHSSGTSRQRPSRHFHSADSLEIYERSLLAPVRQHVLCGLETPATLVCLSPTPALAPHSSLVYMFDTLRRGLAAEDPVFVGGVDQTDRWTLDVASARRRLTRAAAGGRPVIVLGTAFSFLELLADPGASGTPSSETSLPSGFTLPHNSRVLETGGYKGRTRELPKGSLHRLITEHLGVPPSHIVSEYGMCELSSQAYDHTAGHATTPEERVFRFPPWARVVVVSPETGQPVSEGETGLIRVLDLANVRSVLAIQTEDLGVRRGDGFEFAGRAAAAEARGCSLLAS